MGIIAAKENFFESQQYKKYGQYSVIIVFGCLLIFCITQPVLTDSLGPMSWTLLINVGWVMILRMILSIASGICLYWFFEKLIPKKTQILQIINGGSLASYAAYLFHMPFFNVFVYFLSGIIIIKSALFNFVALTLGIPILFIICYYAQGANDKLLIKFYVLFAAIKRKKN
jgi:peptidoglycan/LPS O-acetylase OafA/YrhL